MSEFIPAAATEAVANVLAERRLFVLDEADWHAFDRALAQPAADVPGLRELLSASTVLDPPEQDY
jgi:uncharacterized protein (DUF1778 family)